MRIALLAPLVTTIRPPHEPQSGGSQALVADLAAGLAARGHDVEVFAATGSEIVGVTVVDTGVDHRDLGPVLFRHGEAAADPSLSEWAFQRAWRLIARGDFELAHNHAFDAPAVTAASDLGVPIVHTLHLPVEAQMGGALREVQTSPSPPTVVAVSRRQASDWSKVAGVDAVLRNGVPVERIAWSAEGGDALLFVARLSPEKGAMEALDIAAISGLPLVMAGSDYHSEYAAAVRARCRAEGVELLGPLGRERVWELMAGARALVCPILWEEPFGLTAAEAQAAGTPVVGFDRGALSEVIEAGRTGLLVPAGDVAGAAKAAAAAGRLSRSEIRGHAEATLSFESTLDAHEALYQRILEDRRRGSRHAAGVSE